MVVLALCAWGSGGCGDRGSRPAESGGAPASGRSAGHHGAGAVRADAAPTVDVLPSIPGVEARVLTGPEKALMELAAPGSEKDAWGSEAFSDEASAQMKALAAVLVEAASGGEERPLDAAALRTLLAPDFAAEVPRDAAWSEVFADGGTRVWRAAAVDPSGSSGRLGAEDAIRTLMRSHQRADGVRVHFKTFRYRDEADGPVTMAYFQSVGRRQEGATQQNALWTCRWTRESPPRLRSVHLGDCERVEPVGADGVAGGLRFDDVTRAVAGGAGSLLDQMATSAGWWSARLEKFYHIDTTGHQGLALGDVNGDGLEDMYVLQQGGLPNRMYVQRPDGTLDDVSAAAGVDWMELSHAALLVDLDNDGDQDLAIAQSIQVMLMENTGNGRFVVRHRGPEKSNYFSLAAADYDLDGDLDVYACGYGPRNVEEYADGARVTVPLPYHDSRNGGPNVLLRNDGGWAFADGTAEAGLDEGNDRHSFAASWEDYDNDGDPDLYVANDFGRNNLYRNQGRGPDGRVKFKDVAAAAGVEDMSAGMGVTWGDANRDGLMDFHVSNMFSAAGNRVTYQRQFQPGGDAETLSGLRRHARGNSLFLNKGDGTFTDASVESAITMGRWAWGAQFADFNNDGWQDLYVLNGYITGETKDDL